MSFLTALSLLAFSTPTLPTADSLTTPDVAFAPEITSFQLTSVKEGVRVDWVISDTTGTLVYELERSIDGDAWSVIHTLSPTRALINLTESFVDPIPVTGINEYRLTTVKRDGARQTWSAYAVNHEPRGRSGLYPNPVAIGHPVYLMLEVPLSAEVQLELVDDRGKRIQYEAMHSTGERDQYELYHRAQNQGSYSVRVFVNDVPVESYLLKVR